MTQTSIPVPVPVVLAWSLMCGAALACGGPGLEPEPKTVPLAGGEVASKQMARSCLDRRGEMVGGQVCIEGRLGTWIIDQHLVTESCASVVTPLDRVCVLDGSGRPGFYRVFPIEPAGLTEP